MKELIQASEETIESIIKTKYCHKGENSYNDIIEKRFAPTLEKDKDSFAFYNLPEIIIERMKERRFVPAGSILYGFGIEDKTISLSNCYYIPIKQDSIEGIYEFLKEQARTYSWRGGVGTDISILRPRGTKVNNSAQTSSGSVSFMPLLSESTNTIGQNGRRGAHMITQEIWHPDIPLFVKSKSKPEEVFEYDHINEHLPNIYYANISVKVTDKFMKAVEEDTNWQFIFPDIERDKEKYDQYWNGDIEEWKKLGRIKSYGSMKARELLKLIAECAWQGAEPGVLYWDNTLNGTPLSMIPEVKPRGVNPCFTGDTKVIVYDSNNKLKAVPIEDLAGQKVMLPSYNLKTHEIEPKQATGFQTGVKNVIQIEFENGKTITCTPDHLFIIFEDSQFKYCKAEDLIKNKYVVIFEQDSKFLNELIHIKSCQRVISVTHKDKPVPVYDLTVSDNHNFFINLSEDNFILVHNCAEQVLGDYQNCNLSAINLFKYVDNPYTSEAKFDIWQLEADLPYYLEFGDYIIDKNKHPLPQQNEIDKKLRKVGLEFTGLADMLAALRVRYDSQDAIDFVDSLFRRISKKLLKANISLAKVKGLAPIFNLPENRYKFLKSPYMQRILKLFDKDKRKEVEDDIKFYGLRNSAWLNNGPTGSISLVVGNVTSGIEPLFKISYIRRLKLLDKDVELVHLPLLKYLVENAPEDLKLSPEELKKKYHYVEAHEINYKDRIKMQATLQKYFTDSISSTINLPEETTPEDIYNIYLEGWKAGLKGITIFREGSLKGVLSTKKDEKKKTTPEKIEVPDERNSFTYTKYWKQKKVYVTVAYVDNKPVEVFAKLPYEAGFDDNGRKNIALKEERESNWNALARLVSRCLRRNVPIEEVIKDLQKASSVINDLPHIISSSLVATIAKLGKTEYEKCPACGENTLIRTGGCEVCQTCGYSKCG